MKVKKEVTQNKVRFSQQVVVIIVLAIVILSVIVINSITSASLKRNVEVAVLKTSLPEGAQITEENLEKKTMVEAEYENTGVYELKSGEKKRAIVLWDDIDIILGTYTTNYIRQNTGIYWDELTKEAPKENSYLYNMEGELLKVDFDPEEFGGMLVPGDRINVRIAYSEENYNLPTKEEYLNAEASGIDLNTTKMKQEMLFNEVRIIDMLNSDGESIYDIYYNLATMSTTQRKEYVSQDGFDAAIEPATILLNVTAEEADRYMKLTQMGGGKLLMTLLPRTDSNLILDILDELNIGTVRSGANS